MKKQVLKSFLALLCLLTLGSKAQTYSAWGQAINQTGHMYDTLSASGDSLKFKFVNTHAVAFGTPKLIVYYQGNFGNYFDNMDVYNETLSYVGSTNPSSYGYDCSPEDSTVFTLTATDINTWTADNSIFFTVIPNSGPGSCAISRVRARLVYTYCLSGLPSQLATVTIPNNAVCTSDAPYTLTGSPAGGTFSGQGVSGSTFNPANLTVGSYVINYTATDSQTCTTTGSLTIYVRPSPVVNNNISAYACNGGTTALLASFNGANNSFVWFSDAALTHSLSNSTAFATPSLTQTTDFYVTALDANYSLITTTLNSTDSAIVDENNLAGDDRGGMAITHQYVYLNGDDNAVRYDLNLTPGSGVSLPIRDGIFSDLRSGKLWTLWNLSQNTDPENVSAFTVDALRGLDSNLVFTSEMIHLSQPISMNNNNIQNGIFAGAGKLGIYSGSTQHWYVVDLNNGNVSDIGYLNDPQFYGSENWSDWGVLESDCAGGYSVIYRDNTDDNIHRRVLPNGAVTTVGTFADLSDMASLTFDPWNNRWYWHYEGSGSVFGGNQETLGYANASGLVSVCNNNGLSCPTKVTVTVPADVTFNAPLTTICLNDGAVALTGGSPTGGTYSGIGVGTNANGTVFYPALSGAGTFSINYSYTDAASGCTDMAGRQVTVDVCTGIKSQVQLGGITVFPNPSTGSVYFTVNTDIHSLSVEVIDMQGRVVYKSLENGLISGATKQMDLTDISNGMYLVKLGTGSNQHVERIIISH